MNYRGNALTWQNGRQLASYGSYSFTYNADGLRIGKTNGNVTTEYVLNGSQVMRQIIDNGTTTYIADYIYHENGTPMAFAFYTEDTAPVYYFYETNLQGDIINIYDENGAKVVGFRYDAGGLFNTDKANTTVCTDLFLRASLFRYRSYIYDYETSFYYLQSRYYDYEIGRFINADNQIADVGSDALGYNLYAYCMNNPVNLTDPTGHWPGWATKLAVAVGVVAVVAAVAAITVATAGTGTAAAFVAVGAAKGAAIGLITGAATGAATGAVTHRIETGGWEGAGEAALEGMADGALSGAVTGAITGGIQGGSLYCKSTPSAKPFQVDSRITNALNELDQTGIRPGQTQISQSRVLSILDSYDSVKACSSYTKINGRLYVSEGHHTMVANVIKFGKLNTGPNMGQVVSNSDVVINMLWSTLKIMP